MKEKGNNSQYIQGSPRARIALFAYLVTGGLTFFLLKTLAEEKIEQINAIKDTTTAMLELNSVFTKFIIVLSVFCSIQGYYLLRLGIKTLLAGVYSPPDTKMPFRTKIQTGAAAKLSAIGCLFSGLCTFAIIAIFLKMKYEILKHI